MSLWVYSLWYSVAWVQIPFLLCFICLKILFKLLKYKMKIIMLIVKVKVTQLCPTLHNSMDYTVHGILQASILEWVAFPFSRRSSQHRDRTCLLHCRQMFFQLSHKGSPRILEWVAYPFSSGSSWPRNPTEDSCIAGRFFTNWATSLKVCMRV